MRLRTILSVFLLLALISFVFPNHVAHAVILTVTSTADSGTGSLRAVLAAAPAGAMITFDSTLFATEKTILLTSNGFTIDKNVTIQGPAPSLVTIDGNYSYTVFTINTGSTVNLSGITIQNGNAIGAYGGAINNAGTLSVSNAIFYNNSSSAGITNVGGSGGAIYSFYGSATVSDSTFSYNSAVAWGGAIFSEYGPLTVSNSTFANNSAHSGGAISNLNGADVMVVSNSSFTSNTAAYSGAIDNSGTLTVTNSTFTNNATSAWCSGSGGAISNNAAASVINSTFSNNSANDNGCELSGSGGAILNNNATLTVSNSTFYGNTASGTGGAIDSMYTLTIGNSTFSGNSAGGSGGGINSRGSSTVNIGSTIIANNPAGGGADFSGTVTSLGSNLVKDSSSVSGLIGSDQTGVDPLLNSLASNGGLTQTMSLQMGSPAIGKGNCNLLFPAAAVMLDQRGYLRKSPCDVGAYESGSLGIPTATLTPTPTVTPTVTLTLSSTATKTATPTSTPSRTATKKPTATFTLSRTSTRTPTATLTPSKTPSATPTATFTPSNTATATNALTATFTPSKTPTTTSTATFTPSSTFTPSVTNTATNTPTNTLTATFAASNTATFTPTSTPTSTPAVTLTPTSVAPGQAILVSPSGTITTGNPTFIWTPAANASWYDLRISGSNGYLPDQWFNAYAICTSTTCSVTPTLNLTNDVYTFWVYGWLNGITGTASATLSFTVTGQLPGVPTPISPTGYITVATPTFTWQASGGAQTYYLWVSGQNMNFSQWYTGSTICVSGLCSVTPALNLTNGGYAFWVLAANSVGNSAWSNPWYFTVWGQAPSIPVPIAPASNATITNANPTFTWSTTTNGQWYYLWVYEAGVGTVLNEWYNGYDPSICIGSTCSVTPTLNLPNGNYTWWVDAWGGGIAGTWSSGVNFSVSLHALVPTFQPSANK